MERYRFFVVGIFENKSDMSSLVETAHWRGERMERHEKINEVLGTGTLIQAFEVDTGHPNGNEIHNILSNGVILIQNKGTGMLVTELIARPQQLRRYWEQLGEKVPQQVERLARTAIGREVKGYNNW